MPFSPASRYAKIETATFVLPDGKEVRYLRRRFVPPPECFASLQAYVTVQGDRLDNLSARFLGDPEQFWRLCDSNRALRPAELTETVGRILRITLPEGIPGNSHA